MTMSNDMFNDFIDININWHKNPKPNPKCMYGIFQLHVHFFQQWHGL